MKLHTVARGVSGSNDFRPTHTSPDTRGISAPRDDAFRWTTGQRKREGESRRDTGERIGERKDEERERKTMETLANIATDLRIVREPFEELIRSDQTTLVYVAECARLLNAPFTMRVINSPTSFI